MRRKKRKQKIETSKILLIVSYVFAASVTIFAFAGMAIQLINLDPLTYLVPSSYGMAGTTTGFYLWKAKCENLQKYGGKDPTKLYENGAGDYSYGGIDTGTFTG